MFYRKFSREIFKETIRVRHIKKYAFCTDFSFTFSLKVS